MNRKDEKKCEVFLSYLLCARLIAPCCTVFAVDDRQHARTCVIKTRKNNKVGTKDFPKDERKKELCSTSFF